MIGWGVGALLAVGAVAVLARLDYVRDFVPIGLALTTTALGTLLPVLRDNDMLSGKSTLLAYVRVLPLVQRVEMTFVTATTLPLLIALAEIGEHDGVMLPANAAAIVGAGAISVLIFPAAASVLHRPGGPRPGQAPAPARSATKAASVPSVSSASRFMSSAATSTPNSRWIRRSSSVPASESRPAPARSKAVSSGSRANSGRPVTSTRIIRRRSVTDPAGVVMGTRRGPTRRPERQAAARRVTG